MHHLDKDCLIVTNEIGVRKRAFDSVIDIDVGSLYMVCGNMQFMQNKIHLIDVPLQFKVLH